MKPTCSTAPVQFYGVQMPTVPSISHPVITSLDPRQNGQSPRRPPEVKDALSYLEMVKFKFQERPEVYKEFLDIMKDFKNQTIDAPAVIESISFLFTGHPVLIQGFSTFLPQGYRLDCSVADDNQNTVTLTTPTGTQTYIYTGTPSSGLHLGTNGSTSKDSQSLASQPINDPILPSETPLPPSMSPAPQPSTDGAYSPHPTHSSHLTTPGNITLSGDLQEGCAERTDAPSPVPLQDSQRPVEVDEHLLGNVENHI